MSKLQMVPIKDITVGTRFRKKYEKKALEDLIESIKEKGIVQPITLNKDLVLQAGGRRYVAAMAAELTEVPALIRDTTDELDLREVELLENIQREDLTWQEEAALYDEIDRLFREKFKGKKKWSGRKTAEEIGESSGNVADNLKLAKALKAVPELSFCKSKKDALKLLKKADKHIQVQEAVAEQKERMKKEAHTYVEYAENHFKIGDCREGIQDLIDMYKEWKSPSKIGLVEVDPPYAIDLEEIKKKEGITSAELAKYKEISKEQYPTFLEQVCRLIYSVSAPDSWTIFWFGPTWFCEVKHALCSAGFEVDDIPGIWVKGNEDSEGHGQTNQPGIYLARAYEPFFIARKGKPEVHKQGRSNVFNFKPVPNQSKYHPTQRPIALMEEILQTFATPGTTVMIPFLGSGVTLQAVYRNHMQGFGWELNAHNKEHFLLEVEKDERLSTDAASNDG